MAKEKRWLKVLEPGELPEGRVKPVTCEHTTVCMTHFEGKFGALDNRCPHQGGPLGEGSIENGWLRCPWHGWDYHPITGEVPGGHDDFLDTYDVEVRDDGVYIALPEEKEHVQTVGDVMAETMAAWGVKNVFGMVGHSNLGLADGLRRQEVAGKMRFFGIRHEGAAAFAVSGYGKLTGGLAACLGIAGPGSTNLLTGLWDANVDRAPALALSGQVDTQVLGPGAFQEIDLVAAFGKVAQWTQTVLHTSRHSQLVDLACKSALTHRGVSHLIFPDEVQHLEVPKAKASGPEGRLPAREIAPPEEALAAASDALAAAKRPVFIVGYGSKDHMAEVTALAESLNAPVLTTFKGKGLISDHHPLGCGVLGRSGTPIASWFMNEADLLVVFGASFSNHTGITPKIKTIQVDFDPAQIARFHKIDLPVLGEVGRTATLFRERVADKAQAIDQREEIAARWAIWRAEKERRLAETSDEGLSAIALFSGDEPHRARRRDSGRGRRQQHLFLRALLRADGAVDSDERLPREHWLRAARGDGRVGRNDGARERARRAQGAERERRRRARAVPRGADDAEALRHGRDPRGHEQQRARQDLEGAARGAVGRVADVALEPELRAVRGELRDPRDSRDRGGGARRGADPGHRARGPGAGRSDDRRAPDLTMGGVG